jgi:cell wall assembly regulator SMI1
MDPTFGDEIRKYDRDVMEVLRRLPQPSMTPDEARARKRGSTLSSPAPAADIGALETRIGKPLPPSYRAFLAASDGMVFEARSTRSRCCERPK